MPKSFAIYCSGGASRVVRFYANTENRAKFAPVKVIYDGERTEIREVLSGYFGNALCWFDKSKLSEVELKRIHSSTSKFIHNILKGNKIDYLLCFGEKILKKELIDDYSHRLINFHPSLLPAFRGVKGIDQTLEFGAKIMGNTAHYIDEGIDTGKIILQSAMLFDDFEDYEDVLELQFPMMKIIFRDMFDYQVTDEEIYREIANRQKSYIINRKIGNE